MHPTIHSQTWALRAPRTRPPESERFITLDAFQARLEAEAARHARHLGGFGLLRVGTGEPGGNTPLREALATETRRTDSLTALSDGSFALLAICTDARQLRRIVRRLREAAGELAADRPCPVVAGAAAAGHRRMDADELWMGVCEAYAEARELPEGLATFRMP